MHYRPSGEAWKEAQRLVRERNDKARQAGKEERQAADRRTARPTSGRKSCAGSSTGGAAQRERDQTKRDQKLRDIDDALDEGRLVIRPMTEAEREPLPSARAAGEAAAVKVRPAPLRRRSRPGTISGPPRRAASQIVRLCAPELDALDVRGGWALAGPLAQASYEMTFF